MARVIQGYCLRPHTETVGHNGVKKRWSKSVLRKAAPTLAGSPVTDGSMQTTDSVIGRVTYSEYIEGKGVRYEAEIHDEEAIEKIETGLVELAPRMVHDAIDMQAETAEPENLEFEGLFPTPQPCESVPELGRPGIHRKI